MTTVTMEVRKFRAAVKAAIVVASAADKSLPALRSVLVEWGGEPVNGVPGVRLVTTDRFRLAVVGTGGEADRESGSWLIPVEELKRAVKLLPPVREQVGAVVKFEQYEDDNGVAFTVVDQFGRVAAQSVLTIQAGDFPKFRSLLAMSDVPLSEEPVTLNPAFVADVASFPGDRVRFECHGPSKAVLMSGGGDGTEWLMLLMPVRR